MSDQESAVTRSTDAAMALAHAATATHAIAEMQAAEQTLNTELLAIDRSYEDDMRRALERYRHTVRAALVRYTGTMATIRGGEEDDEDD